MKDFLLTDNGDLSFIQSDCVSDNFELNFFISQTNGMFLNFYIENFSSNSFLKDLTPQFILSFNIKKIEYDKDVILNENDEDYIQQQIRIRLDTCIGTLLENKEIGSELDSIKHRIIVEDDSFEDVKQCIQKAIKDIVGNVEIQVSKINTIYLDYSNSLLVTIKANNYNYFYYL